MTTTPLTEKGLQGSFDDLGTPLSECTFVVVDLETTGGRPQAEGITETGAVKVRDGEIVCEFATLVDPGCAIPPTIERLTGITTSMVSAAPRIASVLPQFLEFLGPQDILVAHNAPFDVGFLKAACRGLETPWPGPDVVDTVKLARALVPRDEVANHRRGTLAAHFGALTMPNHRALADARATVDVLHARLGSLGVTSREDLLGFSAAVPAARRRRASLADGLPSEPGVYVFRDAAGHPLYVGALVDIQRRVKSYFTASENRRNMGGHGRSRDAGHPHPVRRPARSPRARDPPHRRASPAIQPALDPPREGGVAQDHRRAISPLVRRSQAVTRRHLPRALPLGGCSHGGAGRRARGTPPASVHPAHRPARGLDVVRPRRTRTLRRAVHRRYHG